MSQPVIRRDMAHGVGVRMGGIVTLLGLGLALGAASARPSGGPLPTLFTDQDATRGQAVFTQHCAACHGADLRGTVGPALIGPTLGSARNPTTVSILFNVIAFEMPADNPGSLTQQDYAAVMAYILQRNGYPAGSHSLSYAAAQAADVPLISQRR